MATIQGKNERPDVRTAGNFKDFFGSAIEAAVTILARRGSCQSILQAVMPDGEVQIGSILNQTDDPTHQVVTQVVRSIGAFAFVYVDECWVSCAKEARPTMRPKDDPNRGEAVMVIGVHPDVKLMAMIPFTRTAKGEIIVGEIAGPGKHEQWESPFFAALDKPAGAAQGQPFQARRTSARNN